MKRIIFSIAIIAALASCTREPDFTTADSSKVQASAADFQCDDAFTRTTITQSGSSAPTFAWKAGDVLGVIPMDGKTVQSNYEISKIDTDPRTATFDGGVWALKEGKGYAAYYPYSEVVARKNSKLEFSFLGQTQTANNSLEHISPYDYMYAPAVTASSGTTAFNFKHLVSLVRVQITVPKTDQYTTLTLESSAAWFAGKAELSLADGTMTATQSLKTCTIMLDDIAANSGEVLTVWFATLPTAALDGGSLTVKLSGKDSFSTELTGLKTFEAGKAYSFSCTAGSSASDVKCVDLGLSVKWATCNLGATKPEESGNYYAWGELEQKTDYSLNTYKYYKTNKESVDGEIIEYAGYSKYVTESSANTSGFKGFFDDLVTLEPSDDIAHVILGSKWRMPTSSEMRELIDNCQCDYVTYNGVCGRKFTSKVHGYTDKWIFLPVTGYFSNTKKLALSQNGGYYWSSSLTTTLPKCAWNLVVSESLVSMQHLNYYRYFGFAIRPVME